MVLQLLQAWYEEVTTPDPMPVPAVRAAIASMPFMIHVVVSAFALVIFTVLSSLFSVRTPGLREFMQAMSGGKGGSKGRGAGQARAGEQLQGVQGDGAGQAIACRSLPGGGPLGGSGTGKGWG